MTPLDASSYASTVDTVTRNAFAMPRAAALLEGTIAQAMAELVYAEGHRVSTGPKFGNALPDDYLRPVQADILRIMSDGAVMRFRDIKAAMREAEVSCSDAHLSAMVRALRVREFVLVWTEHRTRPELKISDKGRAALANFMAKADQ